MKSGKASLYPDKKKVLSQESVFQKTESYSSTDFKNSTTKPELVTPIVEKDSFASFDKAKSQEIISHLKVVITVSALCLTILVALYYFERQFDWVNSINLKIKELVGGMDWKI